MRLTDIVLKVLCTGEYFHLLPEPMNMSMAPRQKMRKFIRYPLQGGIPDEFD